MAKSLEQMLEKLEAKQNKAEEAGNYKEWEKIQKRIEKLLNELNK